MGTWRLDDGPRSRRLCAWGAAAIALLLIGCAVPLATRQTSKETIPADVVAPANGPYDSFVMSRTNYDGTTRLADSLLIGTEQADGTMALRTLLPTDVRLSRLANPFDVQSGMLFTTLTRQPDGSAVDLTKAGPQGTIIDLQTGHARQVAQSDPAFHAPPVRPQVRSPYDRATPGTRWVWWQRDYSTDRLLIEDGSKHATLWELPVRPIDSKLPYESQAAWIDDTHVITGHAVNDGPAPQYEVDVVDVPTKKVTPVGRMDLAPIDFYASPTPDGDVVIRGAATETNGKSAGGVTYVTSIKDAIAGRGKLEKRAAHLGAFEADGFIGELIVTSLKCNGVQIAPTPGGNTWVNVSFSPDGKRVMWKELEHGPIYVTKEWLFFYDSQTGKTQRIADDLKIGDAPNWPIWATRAQIGAASGDADVPFGDAFNGIQVRIRPAASTWPAGKTPECAVDLSNTGDKEMDYVAVPEAICSVCVDGHWYHPGPIDLGAKVSQLPPHADKADAFTVKLGGWWFRGPEQNDPLKLAAGKHTLAIRVNPERVHMLDPELRKHLDEGAVSNSVVFEVAAPVAATKP